MNMDHAEKLAQLLIEATLEGSKMLFCGEQSHGEYDFDLQHADGIAAVEVTAAVNRAIEEVHAAIMAPRKGGHIVAASQSTKNWMIHPSSDARINIIREKADEYLAGIENDGIEKFWAPTDDRPSVERIYRDLGVVSGAVLFQDEPAQIRISLPITGGAYGADLVHAAVEAETSKQDNRNKLRRAVTAQRHLAIYVPIQTTTVWSALVDLGPRPELPNLPAEITDVWVYSEAREDGAYIVCHGSGSSPWSCIRVRAGASQLENCKNDRLTK
jgi:hypothetical protein